MKQYKKFFATSLIVVFLISLTLLSNIAIVKGFIGPSQIFLPLILNAEPTVQPTEEPTQEPTEEPTQEPTEEPTQEPTEEPTPSPMPGENEQCTNYGSVEICASVSDASPERYSYVTVYGRLLDNDQPQSGLQMFTVWHYKSTTPTCDSGITDADGLASCQRYISGASAGYTVNIDVTIDGYSVQTSFTPID